MRIPVRLVRLTLPRRLSAGEKPAIAGTEFAGSRGLVATASLRRLPDTFRALLWRLVS
jgi:hypothetical protein